MVDYFNWGGIFAKSLINNSHKTDQYGSFDDFCNIDFVFGFTHCLLDIFWRHAYVFYDKVFEEAPTDEELEELVQDNKNFEKHLDPLLKTIAEETNKIRQKILYKKHQKDTKQEFEELKKLFDEMDSIDNRAKSHISTG